MSDQQLNSDAQVIVRALETNTVALSRMTDAIEHLAQSVAQQSDAVMALINALADVDGEIENPGNYLDGSPVR